MFSNVWNYMFVNTVSYLNVNSVVPFVINKNRSSLHHIVIQKHATGAKRIKLDTTQEIAKWREEMRKYGHSLFL